MKTDTHPQYVDGHGDVLLRQHLHHPLDQAPAAHRAVQRLPSLLHRQAEAGRHRRPGRALRAPLRAAGQEVVADERLGQLRAVKLGALVAGHWGKEGGRRRAGSRLSPAVPRWPSGTPGRRGAGCSSTTGRAAPFGVGPGLGLAERGRGAARPGRRGRGGRRGGPPGGRDGHASVGLDRAGSGAEPGGAGSGPGHVAAGLRTCASQKSCVVTAPSRSSSTAYCVVRCSASRWPAWSTAGWRSGSGATTGLPGLSWAATPTRVGLWPR